MLHYLYHKLFERRGSYEVMTSDVRTSKAEIFIKR